MSARWMVLGAALVFVVSGCGSPAASPPGSQAAANPSAALKASSAAAAAPPSTSAAASSSAAAQAAAKPSGTPRLVLGHSQITGNALAAWSAEDGDYFKKNGLDVDAQLLSGGTKTLAALLAGQIQIAEVGGSEVIGASAEGADLVITAVVSPVYPYKMEVEPAIKTPADLKGKKLGIATTGGSADIAGRVVMRKNGVDPDKDVSTIILGDSQTRLAALISGSIQAAMTDPPGTLQVEEKGFRPLWDLTELKLPACQATIVASRSWLNANKATMQSVVDALVQATARVKKDRAFGDQVLGRHLKLDDPKTRDYTYDYYALNVVPAQPFPRPEQFADALEEVAKRNEKARGFDVNKILDATFVKSAVDRGLDKS